MTKRWDGARIGAGLVGVMMSAGAAPLAAAPVVSGELMAWHKVTLTFDGPECSETGDPNPFTDFRFDATFRQGDRQLVVPGYFAADGDAADSSAESGDKWRVHFAPPAAGDWQWSVSFRKGGGVATAESADAGQRAGHFDGESGTLTVTPGDKASPDARALGALQYDGTRYPVTAANGDIFLKAGADAPENFLAYADFDGGFKDDGIKDQIVKTWEPHVRDWTDGDPTWQGGKGKGIIGAVNYLASKGMNAFSFLTMNIEGDDRNVFPYLDSKTLDRLDVSRLAQWEIVFEHGASKGMFLHFKTQEAENEWLLDGGDTGPQRRLYYRELIARFGHHPLLNWNMGEENGKWGKKAEGKWQTTAQRLAMGQFFADHDPYGRPVVIHNPQWPDDVYGPDSPYNGSSLQTNQPDFSRVNDQAKRVLRESADAGKQWMVACDEPGDAQHGLITDEEDPTRFNVRTNALWGLFLAGGWGIEYYFGYKHPHSDLTCQDFRTRELVWQQSKHALDFLSSNDLPLGEMENQNGLLEQAPGFCLAKPGEVYVLMVKDTAKGAKLDLEGVDGEFDVRWFDPRNGGGLQQGSAATLSGGGDRALGDPPSDKGQDWVALVRARK